MITHHVNLAARFADQVLILRRARAVAGGTPAGAHARDGRARVLLAGRDRAIEGRPQMIPLRRRKEPHEPCPPCLALLILPVTLAGQKPTDTVVLNPVVVTATRIPTPADGYPLP